MAKWAVTLRAAVEPSLERLGVEVSPAQWGHLDRLAGLWLQYGRAINLTGARDMVSLAPHVLEALEAVVCARRAGAPAGPWLEVGAGAGLPGLLFAVFVDQPIVLVEPRARRASFLQLAMGALGRPPTDVIRARLHGSTWNGIGGDRTERLDRGGFSVISARAVFRPGRWLEQAIPWVAPGGLVLVHAERALEDPPKRCACIVLDRVRAYRRVAAGA